MEEESGRYFAGFMVYRPGDLLQGIFYCLMDSNDTDRRHMQRAIDLARGGWGHVNPNPLVGAVIVRDGLVIGEGYHRYFGGDHAEIDAIKNVGGPLRGATMYVNLEPCSHYGKTPPCTGRIISEGFSRVVIGMQDPNPLVNGKGIRQLREAGIGVVTGVLEEEALLLNEFYLHHVRTGRPFCILKSAMTLDGRIATVAGDSRWITGPESRAEVHMLRHRVAAVMTGSGTIRADDPLLNDRSGCPVKSDPVRIILDSHGTLPLTARVFISGDPSRTWLAVTEGADRDFTGRAEKQSHRVIFCADRKGRVDLNDLMGRIGAEGIDSVMIEAGSTLAYSALEQGLIHKLVLFVAPFMVGGHMAPGPFGGEGISRLADAPGFRFSEISMKGSDLMIIAYPEDKYVHHVHGDH
ncbi:MAG: bifunctional diaminohydroxyphosphoribosylaminopyrimidine deaminase/5-amino-6-(5-phosphoribosylamino)uracil reductase RibD [Bacteroidales bacterium]|nr:bifunctional diaminohydroxyphosphoribosylaminopyrimidine deaminase/5-amino-6-(5-phosphoribosylamino)uracil reductase RibD [Bacteroidales bacterium]